MEGSSSDVRLVDLMMADEDEDEDEEEFRSQDRPSTTSVDSRKISGTDSIRVYGRVRPQNNLERTRGGQPCLTYHNDSTQVCVYEKNEVYKFNFLRFFQPDVSQYEVYDEVAAPVVEDFLEGINSAILVYGQTSAGKTFTMDVYSLSSSSPCLSTFPEKHLWNSLSPLSLPYCAA